MYVPGGVFGTVTPNQNIYKSTTLETGEVVDHIGFFNQIIEGAPKTLLNLYNLTQIRSASGKTAKPILILQARTANPVVKIWGTPAPGNVAGGTELLSILTGIGWSINSYLTVEVPIPLSSLQYLTVEVTNVGGNVDVEGGAIIRSA